MKINSLWTRMLALAIAYMASGFAGNANNPFDNAVENIVAINPRIQAIKFDVRASQQELRSSNMLPDPEVDGAYQWGRSNVGDKWEISVSQSLDWPGVYASRSKANHLRRQAMDALVKATEADIRSEVTQALIDYVWARRNCELMLAIQEQMKSLQDKYELAYNHGEATILDVNKTRLTYIDASRRYAAAQSELRSAKASIASLAPEINLDSLLNTITDFPAQQLYGVDVYEDAIAHNTPSLQRATLNFKAAETNVQTARRSCMPGFRIGYSHLNELGDHFNGLTFGLNLPVFSARHKVAAARATADAANAELQQLSVSIRANTLSLIDQARTLAGEIAQYGSVATDPRPAQLLRQALDGGELNLLEYLQELSYFNEASVTYLELQRNYHNILAQLNRYLYQ